MMVCVLCTRRHRRSLGACSWGPHACSHCLRYTRNTQCGELGKQFFHNLNFDLRKMRFLSPAEMAQVQEAWGPQVSHMKRAVSKLPAYSGMVYRGQPMSEVILRGLYWPGRLFQWTAWTSSSTDVTVAVTPSCD